jgi:hypothetical protein
MYADRWITMAQGLGNPHHSSTGSNSANESMGTAADWEHLQPDFRTRSFRVCFGIRLIRKLARKKYIFVRSSEIFTLRDGTENPPASLRTATTSAPKLLIG